MFIKVVYERTEPLGAQVRKEVVSKWYYPILYCPKCMPSLWGTLIYVGYCLMYSKGDIFEYALTLACSVTISTIVATMYER